MTPIAEVTQLMPAWTVKRVLTTIDTKREGMKIAPNMDAVPRMDAKVWQPFSDAGRVALNLQFMSEEKDETKRAENAKKVPSLLMGLEPIEFVRTRACPLQRSLTIIYMFNGVDETIVYTLNLSMSDGSSPYDERGSVKGDAIVTETGALRPCRFRLTDGKFEYACESMPLSTWIEEVAEEFDAVTGVPEPPDEDDA